jgi:hypothetical protein
VTEAAGHDGATDTDTSDFCFLEASEATTACKNRQLEPDLQPSAVAKNAHGFSAAGLSSLAVYNLYFLFLESSSAIVWTVPARASKIKNNPIRYSEVCNKLSVNVAKAYHDGKLSSIGRGHKNGWYKSDKFLKSFYYRSSYELKFLEICENLNTITDCKGCNITIPYISKTGTNKNYIPDFFINNKWIIEIKPLKLKNYENNALKSEAGMAYAKNLDMNYIVLTEECLNYDYIKSVCNQSK